MVLVATAAVGTAGCGSTKQNAAGPDAAGTSGAGTGEGTGGAGPGMGTAGTGPGMGTAGTGPGVGTAGTTGTGNGGAGIGAAGTGSVIPGVAPSVDGRLTINELMAANVMTARDDKGNVSGWLELFNPTMQDIPLAGYGLTNDLSAPAKAVLPAGTIIKAGGHLVLWCDGNPLAGPAHVALSLVAAGGVLALARPDGSFIDKLAYGAQEVDLSAAREPDGSDKWVIEWHASLGVANPDAGGKPMAPQAAADPPEMVPAAGDLSDRVLGYDLNPKFELQISDPNIAALRAQPADWVPAMLVYEGRTYGPVGVNLKGTSSFQPIDQKPAFRVNINKFTKGARLFGLKEFFLNNMTTDPSMMHERLAYWIGRQAGGIPTSRSNHALVTLNGKLLGLYAAVEEPKGELMARFFPDPSGPVYTISYADFSTAYLANFQLQDGKDDMSRIVGLITALGMQPADVAMTAAGQYANIHQFARYWALCVLTGHWGGWPYAPDPEPQGANAGIYVDPTTKQLNFIPEGINDAFATADFDFIAQAKSVLAKKCAASTSCYQDFAAQLMELMGRAEQLNWATELDRVAIQIAPNVLADTTKPYTNDDVTMYQQQMRYFMTGRRTFITKYLVQPGTAPIPAPPASM
jgi:CotH kinase protein/Lamin Tail Domain